MEVKVLIKMLGKKSLSGKAELDKLPEQGDTIMLKGIRVLVKSAPQGTSIVCSPQSAGGYNQLKDAGYLETNGS